jgi:hypothetical protein
MKPTAEQKKLSLLIQRECNKLYLESLKLILMLVRQLFHRKQLLEDKMMMKD